MDPDRMERRRNKENICFIFYFLFYFFPNISIAEAEGHLFDEATNPLLRAKGCLSPIGNLEASTETRRQHTPSQQVTESQTRLEF
ncbi:hypothetical protein BJX76DRAFT_275008 [Aspergillus varians]